MAKINLLPWRAERRKQRQQEFMTMLGVAAVAAVLISLLIVLYYNAKIDAQEQRNQYLTDQIASLDKQIAEIAELDKKKAGLLRRKQVIEELQASRSQMVHLFDELARTISDGTQIQSIAQNGAEMTIVGRAQSNARVSTYMRNLDASGWMGSPDLSIIELRSADPGLPNEFSLKVQLKNPNDPNAAGPAGVAAAETVAEAPMPTAPLSPMSGTVSDPGATAADAAAQTSVPAIEPAPAPAGTVPAAPAPAPAPASDAPVQAPTTPPAGATGGMA